MNELLCLVLQTDDGVSVQSPDNVDMALIAAAVLKRAMTAGVKLPQIMQYLRSMELTGPPVEIPEPMVLG
jgi:hypothetical protein